MFGGGGATTRVGFGAGAGSSGLGFGQTTGAQSGGLFQNQNQNQQATGAVLGQTSQITPLTRPSDLAEPFQKEIEALDEYINNQSRICEEITQNHDDQEELIQSIPRDAELLNRKYCTARESLKHDDRVLTEMKTKSDVATADADACFQLLGNLRMPGSLNSAVYGYSSLNVVKPGRRGDQLMPYFKRKVEEFHDRITELTQVMSEVDKAMDAAEYDIVNVNRDPNNIVTTLKEEYALFMSLGNKVAELHHDVGRLEK